jgi:hypothetical protein
MPKNNNAKEKYIVINAIIISISPLRKLENLKVNKANINEDIPNINSIDPFIINLNDNKYPINANDNPIMLVINPFSLNFSFILIIKILITFLQNLY